MDLQSNTIKYNNNIINNSRITRTRPNTVIAYVITINTIKLFSD